MSLRALERSPISGDAIMNKAIPPSIRRSICRSVSWPSARLEQRTSRYARTAGISARCLNHAARSPPAVASPYPKKTGRLSGS